MTYTRDSVEWLRMMRDHSALSDCKPHFARIADEITRLRSQRVAVPEPAAFCEIIDGKVVSVRLDKSRHCTVPLFAHQPAQDGWQDISTAPKDETVLGAVDGEARLIRWCKASHVPFHGWCLVDQGAEDRDLCVPTHWMPRPTPPSAAISALAHGDSNDR